MTLSSASISVAMSHGVIDLQVSPQQAGSRFDHFLAFSVPETSRALLIQSIRKGLLLVDGEKKKAVIGLNRERK